MNRSRIALGSAVLFSLVAGAVALVVVELAHGAAGPVSPTVAKPCTPRPPFPGGGLDATVQRVVLEGLDGAACKLGTTREELVLSLSPSSGRSHHWTRAQVEAAIRSGLTHAIGAEAHRGNIPSLLVPLLQRLVRSTPFEKLIQGSVSLGGLLGGG